jgi:hypothetical protein
MAQAGYALAMPGRAQQAGRTSGYIRNKRFLKKL